VIATFVQEGQAVDFVAAADVANGDVVVVGELVGIAQGAVAAGQAGSMSVTGVYDLPKAIGAGTALAAGVKVNWDATAKVVTTAAGGGGVNKYVGKTLAAVGVNDAQVRVRLSQ
jgi:predicted RecA/RadA family phage recombinase